MSTKGLKKRLLGLKSYLFGYEREKMALAYLQKHKYTILAQNYHTKYGEIDIIAARDGVVHFVEVKSSANYDPHYYLTPSKYNKILKSTQIYLSKSKDHADCVFSIDLLCIQDIDGKPVVDFVENISMN